jgi:hypothetical protein
MATLSITIPDAIAARVLDAVAYGNGYSDMIPDPMGSGNPIPNPITKTQFAKNVLKDWIKANVVSYESVQAADTARQAAIDAANSQIVIGD